MEFSRGVGIGMGHQPYAPRRQDFRNVVHLRHDGERMVARDVRPEHRHEHLFRDPLPDARAALRRRAIQSGRRNGDPGWPWNTDL